MEEEISLAQFMSLNKSSDSGKKAKKKQKFNQIKQNQITIEDLSLIAAEKLDCDSLERFLMRSFEKCKNKKDRKEMRKEILQTIKNYQQMNNGLVNWDEVDVPSLQNNELEVEGQNQFLDPQMNLKIIGNVVKKMKEEILLINLIEQQEDQDENEGCDDIQVDLSNLKQTQALQNNTNNTNSNIREFIDEEDDDEGEEGKDFVVGTSTALEKDYLRLTKRAREEDVRSLETIKKSFIFISNKYQQGEQNYEYFQSQFRSLRQDMNVQGIRGDVAIQIIEHNARVCLQNNDQREYKRCLGQLIILYKEQQNVYSQGYKEFAYYRLIESIFGDKRDELLSALQEMNKDEILVSNEFSKAMQFHHASSIGNVYLFFKLYRETKDHGKYIMDFFINKWIAWGMRILFKTYGPQQISVSVVSDVLGFQNILEILSPLECVYDSTNQKILIKESILNLEKLRL